MKLEYIIATLVHDYGDFVIRSVISLKKNSKIKSCNHSDEDALCDNRQTDSQSQSSTSPPLSAQEDRLGSIDRFMSIVGNIHEMYGLFQQMRSEFRMLSNSIKSPKASVKGIRNTRIGNKKERSNNRLRGKSKSIRKMRGTR